MYTLVAFTALLATFASACPTIERDIAEIQARQTGCTDYGYSQGGRNWAAQCPSQWGLCGNGDRQSPINLPSNSFARTHVPTISFPGGSRISGQIFNRDFGPEWIPAAGTQVPRLSFDGQTLNLLQWHTHTPTSEHAVGGAKTRGEIHFVFGTGSTPRAVLGVRMANGNGSPFWTTIYGALDAQGRQLPPTSNTRTRITINVDFASILNSNFFASGRYWTYNGSLTTPPCDQGLRWYVASNNDGLSAPQFQRLEAASSNSVRVLQPIRNQQINV